jgi:hypothetical protein
MTQTISCSRVHKRVHALSYRVALSLGLNRLAKPRRARQLRPKKQDIVKKTGEHSVECVEDYWMEQEPGRRFASGRTDEHVRTL